MADLRNARFSVFFRNSLLNAGGLEDFDGAKVDVMSGAQPATPETAIGAQVTLVTLTLNAEAFPDGAAVGGVATANEITSGVAGNTGTAAWARIWNSARTQVLMDISVGSSADADVQNFELPTTSIVSGITYGANAFTLTLPMQGL